LRIRSILIVAGATAFVASLAAADSGRAHGRAYPHGAPPGTTGGFGEPTCQQCHFGAGLNEAGGTLALDGVPGRYTPGETYRLVVRLRRAWLGAAGFQLAARTADGAQAGTLAPDDPRTQVQPGPRGVQYAGHTVAGSAAPSPDSAAWTVDWTAPPAGTGPVTLSAAANAADGDRSPLGDYVYALERAVAPR
jgi:hypothetical protein